MKSSSVWCRCRYTETKTTSKTEHTEFSVLHCLQLVRFSLSYAFISFDVNNYSKNSIPFKVTRRTGTSPLHIFLHVADFRRQLQSTVFEALKLIMSFSDISSSNTKSSSSRIQVKSDNGVDPAVSHLSDSLQRLQVNHSSVVSTNQTQ